MIDYLKLGRYALWAAFAGFVWHMASTIHDNIYNNGRTAERAIWQEKEAERSEQLANEIAAAVERITAERDKQVNELTGALENANEAREKLNNDLNAVRTANRGLWISAKNCGDRTDETTGETQSPGVGSVGTERIRLPGQVEQDLWELAADAQRVVIQYQTLLRMCRPLVDVAEDPG